MSFEHFEESMEQVRETIRGVAAQPWLKELVQSCSSKYSTCCTCFTMSHEQVAPIETYLQIKETRMKGFKYNKYLD